MAVKWQNKYRIIRDFLLTLLNKEFLIFLFFLAISTAFWFLSTLNDYYETEIKVPIKLSEVPEHVVVTENLPDSVRITIRDKGYTLLNYIFAQEQKPIRLTYALYAKSKGKGSVAPSDIQKIMKARLYESTTITAVKAERWDFYFCMGTKRRLPVRINGNITSKPNYYVTRTQLTPDSVTVFAQSEAFDTIIAIYTEPMHIENLSGQMTRRVKLQHITGTKVIPSEVSMTIFTDQLTELTFNVPVRTINVPEGVSLKTFPARVEIRVAVGVKRSGSIKAEQFSVVADYNDIQNTNVAIPLRIQSQPKGIVKTYLKQTTVDYVVEK